FQLGFAAGWARGAAALGVQRLETGRRDRFNQDVARQDARQFVRPLVQMPGLSVPGAAPWWHEWLAHDRRDAYWISMSPARDYTEYEVPMLHIGGWWDLFAAGTVRNYQGLRAAGKAAQHLWMGPWAHTHYDQDIGDLRLGTTAGAANAG